MVREDILSGLKHAISKGESLKEAMMSFYRSGYPKGEIEEAARMIQNEQVQKKMEMIQQIQETKLTTQKPLQKISQYIPQNQITQFPIQQKSIQKISNYEEEKNSRLGWIILIAGSLMIIAAVVLVIIFKEQVTAFFNNLIG